MSLENAAGIRTSSPSFSGRTTPVPQVTGHGDTREDDASLRKDKSYRRYAAGIERALASLDPTQQEWADYIAFLARLLKAIQAVQTTTTLPHARAICLRLAQCLSPSLPSGVHQKALEVYDQIFRSISSDGLGLNLDIYLPPLAPVLSFASLSIRPLFYSLLEMYVVKLDHVTLRPAAKSIILCLLPGIEDETSEDFDKGLGLLDSLRRVLSAPQQLSAADPSFEASAGTGFFWQCFFLASITSPSRRQGSLIYMTKRLPHFGALSQSNGSDTSSDIDAVLRPEPGLLVRCFTTGLCDPQPLIQRGFLDLLVSHLPLYSAIIQHKVQPSDARMLVSAAITVVLRKDMSLNRRLWAWLLGPDATNAGDAEGADSVPATPVTARHLTSSIQVDYFRKHGQVLLHDCVMQLFTTVNNTKTTQPYRILLSLMDRSEVAANLIPGTLIPALRCAEQLSLSPVKSASLLNASLPAQNDLLRSASLFFDAVESPLIWSKLVSVLLHGFEVAKVDPVAACKDLDLLLFVITNFNINEEDMLLQHIPNTLLLALHGLCTALESQIPHGSPLVIKALAVIHALIVSLPDHAPFTLNISGNSPPADRGIDISRIPESIKAAYQNYDDQPQVIRSASSSTFGQVILQTSFTLLEQLTLAKDHAPLLQSLLDSIQLVYPKIPDLQRRASMDHLSHCLDELSLSIQNGTVPQLFHVATAMVSLVVLTQSPATLAVTHRYRTLKEHVDSNLLTIIWQNMALGQPKHHVEAVRLLWQMHAIAPESVSAYLASTFTDTTHTGQRQSTCERFAVLWDLTMQQHAIKKRDSSMSQDRRRSSNLIPSAEMLNSSTDYEQALTRPLLMMLDYMGDGDEGLVSFLTNWLRNLPSLDRVLTIIFLRMSTQYASVLEGQQVHVRPIRKNRQMLQDVNDIANSLGHLRHILERASLRTWQTLSTMSFETHASEEGSVDDGLVSLARFCVDILRMPVSTARPVKQHALLIMQLLLASPEPWALVPLQIELSLMSALKAHLSDGQGALQTVFLDTVYKALTLKAASLQQPMAEKDNRQSSHLRQPPLPPRPEGVASAQHLADPPSEVIRCITYGLSLPACRPHLENWTAFMNHIFPLYGDSILTAMIPLTECLCKQIEITFRYLTKALSKSASGVDGSIPVTALSSLLTGLELLLANPHLDAQGAHIPHGSTEAIKNQPSANMVPGLFSSQGHDGRMSQVNSRLTLILCIQDSLRTCFAIWNWATSGYESAKSDPTAAATTTLSSLKLRHRTKRMIDSSFNAEGLECLEALIFISKEAQHGKRDSTESSSVLTLLHTLNAARPRNTFPYLLHALYSRTEPDALDAAKRSTLTCDLTGTDVVTFMLDYVRTMEDDAMDDIWSECTGFLRDVLSNPLPHRSVLPGLLEVIVLIAEKIDNTNHGEQRKMHRDLGDIFLRLLTATFTARPPDYMSPKPKQIADWSGKTFETQNRGRDFLDSLVVITARLGAVLEGNDRITSAVNLITTSVITPSLHAKVFPENIGIVTLQLLQNLSIQGLEAKLWRKEVSDAFNDQRFFAMPPDLIRDGWFPLLKRWCLVEKDRVPELLTRIVAPATAGIMFGVGASAARMEADRKTQTTLRRISMLSLACDSDFLVASIQPIQGRLAELLTASPASSPSSAVRADVFMTCRALVLCNATSQLSGLWPMINSSLVETLSSAIPGSADRDASNNMVLMQACKLLDMLITLGPDDFQLHEWLYLSNTIDAVYKPADVTLTALTDQIAETLSTAPLEPVEEQISITEGDQNTTVSGQPFLSNLKLDSGDMKAMAREDFLRTILQPYFAQLGMRAYEATYELAMPDLELCKWDLLRDLLDQATIA